MMAGATTRSMARLTTGQVLRWIAATLPEACIVSSCGYPTRALQAESDRDANFYLVGSMGMASPIAYGIALARPNQRVVAIDGDGSLAMNLSALVLAEETGADVLHIILDNGVHDSTGGQRAGLPANITGIALASGYRRAVTVREVEDLDVVEGLARETGPRLVHAIVAPHGAAPGRRVQLTPPEILARIRNFLEPDDASIAAGRVENR